MPKVGMEPIRRTALIKATIAEIAQAGSLDVTVSQIARRAGMSSALAHHYFGSKDAIFLAAMRQVLSDYGAEVRAALSAAQGPHERVQALIRVSFSPTSFRREVIAAWLNFYVLAQTRSDAARLLAVYQRRLVSNLAHALRPVAGASARALADGVAAMIDGVYLREALGAGQPDGGAAARMVEEWLAAQLRSVPA